MDANRAAGRQDPTPTGPDTRIAQQLGRLMPAEDLRRVMDAYLADRDAFVVKQGHALRLLPGRVDAYRNGISAGEESVDDAINRIWREKFGKGK